MTRSEGALGVGVASVVLARRARARSLRAWWGGVIVCGLLGGWV